jgi:hypothetical protein
MGTNKPQCATFGMGGRRGERSNSNNQLGAQQSEFHGGDSFDFKDVNL